MNFLTPLFLFGGASIALPIVYHLIRRTTRERTVFSSLMFLLPSPPRISKKHKLQHLLLLLLRCLALALLALGFARPFFRQSPLEDPTAAQPIRIAVLVDISASMRRDGLWAAAREKVDAVLRRAGPADQVALLTFDRTTSTLMSIEEWNRTPASDRVAFASSRLAAVSPSWSGTMLGNALVTAAETLSEIDTKAAPGPRRVVLVSDLQTGSRLDTLQAYEWPKGIELLVEPVVARNVTNAGLQLVADAADTSRNGEPTVRVRVSNSADAKREQFKVGWARADGAGEFSGTPIEVYVPPGQNRVVALAVPKSGPAPQRISLRGDDEDFDNTVYVIPPSRQRVDVLWLGAEDPADARQPLFFLRRALSDTPRLTVQLKSVAPNAPLSPADVQAANLIFVSDAVSPATAAALREQAQAGKTIVLVPRNAEAGATLGTLLGREGMGVSEMRPSNYAMFAEIDFQHPLFAPFADPRFSDFTKIHIWKYRKFDVTGVEGARVVAKLDSGDPAIVEAAVGKGRVVALATGWHPDDSQLAVSTKFVPLVWSLLEMGGGIATAPSQYFIGDKVATSPLTRGATAVRAPGGASTTLTAEAGEFAGTLQPGIYEFTGGAQAQTFAVNVDANESRTAPLAPDDLEQLGVPVTRANLAPDNAPADKALLQAAEAENRQKLWRWFIAATLAVLLVESALAGWTARRSALQTEGVPS